MNLVTALRKNAAEALCNSLRSSFKEVRFAVVPRSDEISQVVCEHDVKPVRNLTIKAYVDGYLDALADANAAHSAGDRL